MTKKENKDILIKKASGETELFDVSKLKASLKNAGADDETTNEISADIENWVSNGITTGKIYARAYKLFRSKKGTGSLRYKLKQSLYDMGPTGYPFEYYVGELFKRLGYEVEVGQVVGGVSITHEMDVIATKDAEQHLMECKFALDQGKRISIQVPLYVHSRVNDIVEKRQEEKKYKNFTFTAWVVTNARFSADSIEYSRCKGIQLLGWDYPKDNSLKDLIEREMVFPVTIMKHLSNKEKQALMNDGIVTCSQLMNNPNKLNKLGLNKRQQRAVMNELEEISAYN